MSVYVLLAGELIRTPERRKSKNGHTFVTTLLKVVNGPNTEWWKVVVFDDRVQEELLQLRSGDAASVRGHSQVETYQAESGETKLSMTCFASAIMALRQPSKTRDPAAADKTRGPAMREEPAPFDDEICF
jgi:single-stranded DNA-binding protein